jgi:integrase
VGVTLNSMKELMCTHLAKRGSTYYFRRKTPLDLIEVFGTEIMKSLGSKDRREAEVLVRKMGSHYDELFSQARAIASGGNEQALPTPPPQAEIKTPPSDADLTIDDAHIFAARFLKRLRASRERALAKNNYKGFLAALDNLIANAEEYLKLGDHPFDEQPEPLWKQEAKLRAAKAIRSNTDLPYMDATRSASKPAPAVNEAQSLRISDLIDKWAAERTPRQQSVTKMKRVIQRFEELVGVTSLPAISKSHIVKFKDGLLSASSSPANVNQYLTELTTLLNFAKNQAIIDANPATGVRVKVHESAKTKRQPFDLPALSRVFNSPIYSAGERPLGGKGEAAYWLPLLGLYTGARLEELCQLDSLDLREESYRDEADNELAVWVLHLTDEGDEQKLKNAGSRRRIPVHKELIALGFIDYVQKQGSGRIFPKLTASRDGKLSASWSKWFGRYLRGVIQVTDERMVFHSFRHCFKDYARMAGIPSDVHNALTGHSSGDVADNYGSDKYPLRPLVDALSRYKVPGLKVAGTV